MSDAEEQVNKTAPSTGPEPTAELPGACLEAGSRIGHFRIEREIGRGGMGVVYLAYDITVGRSVAVKSLPPELMADRRIRSRLERDARLLASLSHPNIATIHEEVEETEDRVYLVLEYVPGRALAERIAASPLSLEEALSIACQTAAALSGCEYVLPNDVPVLGSGDRQREIWP